jgi:gluconolactonase
MKKIFFVTSFLSSLLLFGQQKTENYAVDSASVERAGVPKGEVLKFTFNQSKIFPGTARDCWVYVPAQYKADKPACVCKPGWNSMEGTDSF